MAIATYSELVSAIGDFPEFGDEAGYVAAIPTFIVMAEANANRRLRLQQMEEEATITTDANGVGALPADFLAPRMLYRSSGDTSPIEFVATSSIKGLNPYNVSGTATKAAITGGNFQTYPLETGDFVLQYFEKIPALSDSNTTNWLLDLASDYYLYAALSHGMVFVQDEARASMFAGMAAAIERELIANDGASRYAWGGTTTNGPTP